MTEAKTIAEALPDLSGLTVQSQQPTECCERNSAQSLTLDKRPTLEQCAQIVAAGVPALPKPNPEYLAKCLATLLAALPRRSSDEVSGELLFAAYRRKLSDLPDAQITFMTDRALERCEWFPTIAELLTIAGEWKRSDRAMREYLHAEGRLRWAAQERYERLMADIAARRLTQEQINDLPERIKQAAYTYGHLHRDSGAWGYRPLPTALQIGEGVGG